MAEAVLETLDTPAVVVGFSMGAIVSVEIARRAPQLVRGLGLIGFNASADLPERSAARPRQQAQVRAGRLCGVVADELKPNYLAEANRGDVGLRDTVMRMALSLGVDAFVAQSEALRSRADLRPILPSLSMPVLLACGAEDRLCPPEWHRDWGASVAGGATVLEIAGAGHLLPLEQPQALADALLKWLEEEVT
jgi:pimeloyl-ACP methyl ester carboxylesterase